MECLPRPRAMHCRRSDALSPARRWASSEMWRPEEPPGVERRRAGSCPFPAPGPRAVARPALDSRSRSTSECPPFPLLCDVVAGSHREREYGPGRILVRLRDERAAIRHEQILDVMRPAVRIKHGLRRIGAHANRSQLVDDGAACRDAVALGLIGHLVGHLPAHVLHERAKSLLHVANLVVLVVGPLPMEAEHGNSVLVLHDRIELSIALVVRNHLPPTGEVDACAIVAAVVFLEGLAIPAARGRALDSAPESVAGRIQPATDFDVVAAREIELLVVDPPRHVAVSY